MLGEVVQGGLALSALGQIAQAKWIRTTDKRPYLVPDAFVVIPNYVYLLFGLAPEDG